MRKFNKKDYEVLKPFEKEMYVAVNANYTRLISKTDLEIMLKLYKAWNGKDYTGSMSCSSCVLRLVRECGQKYFEYKDKNIKEDGDTEIEGKIIKKDKAKGRGDGEGK